MSLATSKTFENLKAATVHESRASRHCLFFAEKADLQGRGDVAAALRSVAQGEAGQARGHLELLEGIGAACAEDLKIALVEGTFEAADRYSGMARTARDEGYDEVADWFETLARAGRRRADRLQRALTAPN